MSDFPLNRRHFLGGLAAIAGSTAISPVLAHDGLDYATEMQKYAADHGAGKSVAVLGAGIAGIYSAWQLALRGFDVTVFELDKRYGGRSLTVRPTAQIYRDYFAQEYGITGAAYVDSFQERDGELMQCQFYDDAWDEQPGSFPQELYLNAGPGRIPSFHFNVLELTRDIGVELEPFIFASRANLLQHNDFNGGAPMQLRRVKHNLRGHLAEKLWEDIEGIIYSSMLSDAERIRLTKFQKMLSQFGDLQKSGDFEGSVRAGQDPYPGGWRNPGVALPEIPENDILYSDIWDGRLYNDMRDLWQASLMQPKGGMDMIWQKMLHQPLPNGKTVRDLIRLGAPAELVGNAQNGNKVLVGWGGENGGAQPFDFCVSTMPPDHLSKRLQGFDARFTAALAAINFTPSCKVGWQAKTRFWEDEGIYGGISWTNHQIVQMWYPSDGIHNRTGVLTGAYNSGATAGDFGKLPHAERIKRALAGGNRLHAGFVDLIHADRGVSIAWQNMPGQSGGWADQPGIKQPNAYRQMTEMPQDRLLLAGDYISYTPGWMEGSIDSSKLAIAKIMKIAGDA